MARLRPFPGAAAPLFFIFLFSAPALAAEKPSEKPAEVRTPPFELKAGARSTLKGLFPEELIGMKDLRELQKRGEKLVIFDARGKQSYDSGHIAGAILPLTPAFYEAEDKFSKGIVRSIPDREKDLKAAMKALPKDSAIVTYCNDDCQASSVLLLQLKRLGFPNVRALKEGYQTWEKAGYPVEKKA